MYNIDFRVISDSMPLFIVGIKTTVFISVISALIALFIGIGVVYIRTMTSGFVNIAGTVYVEIIRNTPLLIQIYFVYKALPKYGLHFSPITCGIIALSVYAGAYVSEVLRSGINSITKEQYQAAIGLGLNKYQAFIYIIFPQAIRIVIPPLGSQFINLVKNSSLVSFIAVTDIFYVVYKGAVDDFRFFEFFIVGALIYMCLGGIIAGFTHYVEKISRIQGREARV